MKLRRCIWSSSIVVLPVLLLISLCVTRTSSVSVTSWQHLSNYERIAWKHSLAKHLPDFVSYHLYFKTADAYMNGPEAETESASPRRHSWPVSPVDLASNATELMFRSFINSCPNPHYYPRNIQPDEIILKNSASSRSSAAKSKNASLSAADSTDSNTTTTDDSSSNDSSSDIDRTKNAVVHKHLILLLMIPSHPYSTRLLQYLLMVAPMFPSLTIVTANAYNFKQFSYDYDVSTFPKLIFFKDGREHSKYRGVHDPGALAEELAKLTDSLPQAYPKTRRLVLTRPANFMEKYERKSEKDRSSFEDRLYAVHRGVQQVLLFLSKLPPLKNLELLAYQKLPATEPLIGAAPLLVEHDMIIVVIAALYSFSRFVYGVYNWIYPRRAA